MKILLDQNLSYRLVKKLESVFPETQHVGSLGLVNKTDREIWDLAKRDGFIIVTFDSDFYDLSLTEGHPPKIIWINLETLQLSTFWNCLLKRLPKFSNLQMTVSWAV